MTAQDKTLKENTASSPLPIVAPGTCVETGEQAKLVLGMLSLPFKRMVATIAIVATVWLAKKIRTRLKKRSRRAQKARALLTKSGFFTELMVQKGKLFSKLRKRKKEEQANDRSKN